MCFSRSIYLCGRTEKSQCYQDGLSFIATFNSFFSPSFPSPQIQYFWKLFSILLGIHIKNYDHEVLHWCNIIQSTLYSRENILDFKTDIWTLVKWRTIVLWPSLKFEYQGYKYNCCCGQVYIYQTDGMMYWLEDTCLHLCYSCISKYGKGGRTAKLLCFQERVI